MNETPKANRLHIALFGRTNVGKSSLLNFMVGQNIAITSAEAGTTTDVVEKAMELLPLGPVLLIDTAGLDDLSSLAASRMEKTAMVFDRADAVLLVLEADLWTEYEEEVLRQARKGSIPVVAIVNKDDIRKPSAGFVDDISKKMGAPIVMSSTDFSRRDAVLDILKTRLSDALSPGTKDDVAVMDGLIDRGSVAVLVVPIDLGAPKGRIILPQVQTIRDILDHDGVAVIVKEGELSSYLTQLKGEPRIVVCDSQVVRQVSDAVPERIPLTTFSILFARHKGDLATMARGAAAIERLREGSRVLVVEACSHHPSADDIGRIKLPAWLRQYCRCDLDIDVATGREYPDNLNDYDLVIHCGGCMLTRRQMLVRIEKGSAATVPVTNYGVAISLLQGVLERVLSPFPSACEAWRSQRAAQAGCK